MKMSHDISDLVQWVMDNTDPEEFDKARLDGIECITMIVDIIVANALSKHGNFLDILVDALDERMRDLAASHSEEETKEEHPEAKADREMCKATEALGELIEDYDDGNLTAAGAAHGLATAIVNEPEGWVRLIKAVAGVRRFHDVMTSNNLRDADDIIKRREQEINSAEAL